MEEIEKREDWDFSRLKMRLFDRLAIGGVDECWDWKGAKTGRKYGSIWNPITKRDEKVHRVAWEVFRGPIPPECVLDHLCCNKMCANPNHLEPVTARENTLRGTSPSARHARQTHCIHGHEFTEENTYVWRGRMRSCRICKQHARERYRERTGKW